MTVLQNKEVNPIAHLSDEDIENLGAELDAIRADVIASRGERDATYIRELIARQRALELASRVVLLASRFPAAWIVGTAGLSVAKILENMEIGHNVMHGQWDWMRDPRSTPPAGSGTTSRRRISGSTPQRAPPHVHQRDRQGQRPRLRDHARRRGPALDPLLPRPAAVELHQRLLLRVRHRRLRPRAGQEPGQGTASRSRLPARVSRSGPRSGRRSPRTTSSAPCSRVARPRPR